MDRTRRILAGLLIIVGSSGFVIGLATVVPTWALLFGLAAVIGVIFATPTPAPRTPKLVASSRIGTAEAAHALAKSEALDSIDCAQCQKTIGIDEWPDHVNWHRLAEGPPPAAQA